MAKLPHCETLNDLPAKDLVEKLKTESNIILAVSEDFWDSEDHWETCEEAFGAYYEDKVKELTALLGAPQFSGSWQDQGFPFEDASQAHAAAVWEVGGQKICLALNQEDRELPFIVFAKRL